MAWDRGAGSRAQAERDRQSAEKRRFISIAGIGFSASLLLAVMLGHRRAHRLAKQADESIQSDHVNWAARAFGLGTLYAVGFVGCSTAAASYYLQSKGVNSMSDFSRTMRTRTVDAMGGRSLKERLGISTREDREALESADRLLTDPVDDGQVGERKIRFARIKRLLENTDVSADQPVDDGKDSRRLTAGAKMRRAFGFGPKKDNENESQS
ncbi:hypothetical protein IWW38_003062 [Coemansia aciculifera]|uniref:Uncharacterized protein n=1 Tax=Coemansia aciculifera TaxID=417176 RepID=A0ACC1M3K0_9FUNG|nr:hypothetical protein IWW38_003062 [Coemansia aciculifera]